MGSKYRLFTIALIITAALIAAKYVLHLLGWELIVLGSLHSSAISGVIFVIGFLLSATIADYKEAERIPAEAASILENVYEDIETIHANYPKVDLVGYRTQLEKVARAFTADLRNSKSHQARAEMRKLDALNAELETAGVPANFIVKLKQQQAALLRHLFRVNYIQRITFMPSATILVWSIVSMATALLLFTEIEPFMGGMILTGVITFIMFYVLLLIRIISTPFHDEGKTKDDVSLFLLERTIDQIKQ
jgi:hypothetical protein